MFRSENPFQTVCNNKPYNVIKDDIVVSLLIYTRPPFAASLCVHFTCLCGHEPLGTLITAVPQNAGLLWPPSGTFYSTVLTHVHSEIMKR